MNLEKRWETLSSSNDASIEDVNSRLLDFVGGCRSCCSENLTSR